MKNMSMSDRMFTNVLKSHVQIQAFGLGFGEVTEITRRTTGIAEWKMLVVSYELLAISL
jgi:hypothetical protein